MKRKCLFLFLCFSIFVFAFWLGVWTARIERYAHYTPEYAKVDIVPILQKEKLEAADYEVLLQQTGVNRLGVDTLWETNGQSELLYLQERFWAEAELVCLRDFFVVQSERLVKLKANPMVREEVRTGAGVLPEKEDVLMADGFLADVQEGDILISFSGHVFGWRNGHAAIVVDARDGLTLEAITLGSDSRICRIEKWAEYPCYALLRLKGTSVEERAAIAAYAEENLVGVSYRLLSFSGEVEGLQKTVKHVQKQMAEVYEPDPTEETLTGTHCAHLVWAAYAHFGYDLDSDGGYVVTPRDIFDSDLLEVVQIYGIPPEFVERE